MRSLLPCILALAVGTACGEPTAAPADAGEQNPDAGTTLRVSITPPSLAVQVGQRALLTARAEGVASQDVLWSVVEDDAGAIVRRGTSAVYDAPAKEGIYTVKATSIANPTIFGTATVVVTSAHGSSLHIYPEPVSHTARFDVSPLGQQTFTALEYPEGVSLGAFVPVIDVRWSVVEGPPGGAITSDGNYAAPANVGSYHVYATVPGAPTKSAIAQITVKEDSRSISLRPAVSTVAPGGTVQLEAEVSGPPGSLNWRVVGGAERGTVTQTGLYTAPSVPGVYVVEVFASSGFAVALGTIIVQ